MKGRAADTELKPKAHAPRLQISTRLSVGPASLSERGDHTLRAFPDRYTRPDGAARAAASALAATAPMAAASEDGSFAARFAARGTAVASLAAAPPLPSLTGAGRLAAAGGLERAAAGLAALPRAGVPAAVATAAIAIASGEAEDLTALLSEGPVRPAALATSAIAADSDGRAAPPATAAMASESDRSRDASVSRRNAVNEKFAPAGARNATWNTGWIATQRCARSTFCARMCPFDEHDR